MISTSSKLVIIIALFWFAQYVYVPFTTPFLLMQKVSADAVGIIVGLYGATQMLLRFPIGISADLLGRHKLFVFIGCLSAALGSVSRLISPNEIGFFIGNILSGIGSSMWISFIVLYTRSLKTHSLQKAMGYIFAANNGGIFIAFCVSAIFYDSYGMMFLCSLSVIAGLLGILIVLGVPNHPPKEIKVHKLKELILVCKNKRLNVYAFVALIQQGVLMATVMSFTTAQARIIGASSFEIGLLTVIFILFGILSSLFGSTNISIRIGSSFWIVSVMFLLGIYCLITPFITNIFIFIAIQAIVGISAGLVFSWCNSESVKDIDPTMRSAALGYFQGAFGCGMTIIPIISGALIKHFVILDYAFYFQAILCFISCVVLILYKTHHISNKKTLY